MNKAIGSVVDLAKGFFGLNQTVDSVTNVFSKAIDDLKKVELKEQENARAQFEAIEKAKADREASVNEAARASKIAFKLGELVGQVRA